MRAEDALIASPRTLALLVLALLQGCGGIFSDPGGGGCVWEESDVELQETTSLGLSADDAAARIGERSATLAWSDGGSTSITFEAGAPEEASLIVQTPD